MSNVNDTLLRKEAAFLRSKAAWNSKPTSGNAQRVARAAEAYAKAIDRAAGRATECARTIRHHGLVALANSTPAPARRATA